MDKHPTSPIDPLFAARSSSPLGGGEGTRSVMKIWTVHEKPHASPILVREGLSFGALFFGPIWLLAQGAWLPAIGAFLLAIAIPLLTRLPASVVLEFAL